MERRLEGKAALVTGAASGIGKATAIRLAAEGAVVFAADLNADGAAETCEAILQEGGRAESFTLDVSDRAACRTAVATAVEDLGGLDVLCNVAGVLRGGWVTEVADEEWDLLLAVNLTAVFALSQAAIPALLPRKGCIVNMASSAGLAGQAYASVYAATKAGVISLTKSMALEYAKQGLRVNAVCPGAVMTPMVHTYRPPEDADPSLMDRLNPLVAPAEPQEIAAAVAYLASPEARYVNGATLSIDGAQTAG
ncbi:MAG: SDR family oxidoreductase [bacterium]|nr:SDR family oxidoreductase [bacterium]MCP5069527.1 SDR family oxidoreductase [bacterium]